MNDEQLYDEQVRDLMRRYVETTIKARADDRRWDVQPTITFIAAKPTGKLIVQEGPLPRLDGVPQREILHLMAGTCRRNVVPDELKGMTVIGLVVASEGYTLDIPDDADKATIDKAIEWVGQHAVADHPWGVEVKLVSAVDVFRTAYITQYHRRMKSAPEIIDSTEVGAALEGGMPDAMFDLLDALRDALARA